MSPQIVVPARNEAQHLQAALEMLSGLPGASITVVDNASSDETAYIARRAGARVLHESRIGKGFAALAGIRAATSGHVFLCDADVKGLSPGAISDLFELADSSAAPLVRLAIGRSPEDAPVTTLTAIPVLGALGIDGVSEPLGGLVLLDRNFVLTQHLPGGWGFDVALTMAALRVAGIVPELKADGISHRHKPLAAYRTMAQQVVAAILVAQGVCDWDHHDCIACSTDPQYPVKPWCTRFKSGSGHGLLHSSASER